MFISVLQTFMKLYFPSNVFARSFLFYLCTVHGQFRKDVLTNEVGFALHRHTLSLILYGAKFLHQQNETYVASLEVM